MSVANVFPSLCEEVLLLLLLLWLLRLLAESASAAAVAAAAAAAVCIVCGAQSRVRLVGGDESEGSEMYERCKFDAQEKATNCSASRLVLCCQNTPLDRPNTRRSRFGTIRPRTQQATRLFFPFLLPAASAVVCGIRFACTGCACHRLNSTRAFAFGGSKREAAVFGSPRGCCKNGSPCCCVLPPA